MSQLDEYTQLPICIDPRSKAVSPTHTPAGRDLEAELASLNTLHRAFLNLDPSAPGVPPPPVPVNPKRSAQVAKLRESGNDMFRRSSYADAVKLYTLGIQMALTRPPWEPAQLVREDVSALYTNRAQAYMALEAWAEGAVDAEASVEAKPQGNTKAWWRRGKCLVEMGRLEEAREWVARGLEVEGGEQDLLELLHDIERRIEGGSPATVR